MKYPPGKPLVLSKKPVGLFEKKEARIKLLLYSGFVFKTQNWRFSDWKMFLETGRRSSSQPAGVCKIKVFKTQNWQFSDTQKMFLRTNPISKIKTRITKNKFNSDFSSKPTTGSSLIRKWSSKEKPVSISKIESRFSLQYRTGGSLIGRRLLKLGTCGYYQKSNTQPTLFKSFMPGMTDGWMDGWMAVL